MFGFPVQRAQRRREAYQTFYDKELFPEITKRYKEKYGGSFPMSGKPHCSPSLINDNNKKNEKKTIQKENKMRFHMSNPLMIIMIVIIVIIIIIIIIIIITVIIIPIIITITILNEFYHLCFLWLLKQQRERYEKFGPERGN